MQLKNNIAYIVLLYCRVCAPLQFSKSGLDFPQIVKKNFLRTILKSLSTTKYYYLDLTSILKF